MTLNFFGRVPFRKFEVDQKSVVLLRFDRFALLWLESIVLQNDTNKESNVRMLPRTEQDKRGGAATLSKERDVDAEKKVIAESHSKVTPFALTSTL